MWQQKESYILNSWIQKCIEVCILTREEKNVPSGITCGFNSLYCSAFNSLYFFNILPVLI